MIIDILTIIFLASNVSVLLWGVQRYAAMSMSVARATTVMAKTLAYVDNQLDPERKAFQIVQALQRNPDLSNEEKFASANRQLRRRGVKDTERLIEDAVEVLKSGD